MVKIIKGGLENSKGRMRHQKDIKMKERERERGTFSSMSNYAFQFSHGVFRSLPLHIDENSILSLRVF